MHAEVIAKGTGAVTKVPIDAIDFTVPSIVRLDITRAEIAGFERQGHDLVIRLANGEQIRVADFYMDGATIANDLVLRETDGTQWLARVGGGSPRYSILADLEDLTGTAGAAGGGSGLTIPAILGGIGAAGAAAAVALGGGGDARSASDGAVSDPDPVGQAPDRDPPAAPTATVSGDGRQANGRGEAGATVQVRDASGAVVATATVGADGAFSAPLATPRVDGQPLAVTQTDAAGNVSPATPVQAPDLTAPPVPAATIDGAGATVTGTGEPGARVTVTGAGGTVLGTAIVTANGSFQVPLTAAQANGQPLSVVQADPAGNTSPPLALTAPDTTAPAAPTATVASGGGAVVGTAEPGATVTVTGPGGVLATGPVAADGSFTVLLPTPQANGEPLSVTQADPAGNVSLPANLTAPDVTVPAAPVASVSADGAQVTGTGEPGATVAVSTPGGGTIGSGTVATDGRFTVPIAPAQANGGTLSVVQTDPAGNASPPSVVTAPDRTAPDAPVASLDATGSIVTGSGEAGATVTVTGPGGVTLGTATVTPQGNYAVVLTTPQIDSQPLAVVQRDPAGNASPAAALVAPDLTAPAAPTATVSADGTGVAGSGEPGATVVVRNPVGAVIGSAVVAADGRYAAAVSPAQVDGETLTVRQSDAAGNVSPPATTTAPDLAPGSAPAAPTAGVSADGASVAGTAVAGATITVYDAGGRVIAGGTAAADGRYTVTLTPPLIDAEIVHVTQTAADGDVSPPATAIAPDLTAPPAPLATLDATGAIVTGIGEPGATVAVRAADGTLLGTATVSPAGGFVATLAAPQLDGQTLSVTQADGADNVSGPTALVAADTIAPAAPTATVSTDGAQVTGLGEPGARITITDPTGTPIGTATVGADGRYVAALSPPQLDGERLIAIQADPAGNASPPATAVAPDLTPPAAPSLAIAADGALASGRGEVGATVTLRGPDGAIVATATVGADGRYAISLAPPRIDGEPFTATQADATGNVSPAAAATAPDLDGLAALSAQVSADGTAVTGAGEAGATITIRDPAGVTIGSGQVAADGSYSVALTPRQVNGEVLTATQVDASGAGGPPVRTVAPDLTAPPAPVVTIADDGAAIAGTGEMGARVTVTAPGIGVIATVTVDAEGRFTAPLAPPQANGERLSVVQVDAAGNASPTAAVTAPDLTAPAAPVIAVDTDGTVTTGTGEPGARVTVTAAGGGVVGTAIVDADGSFTIPLAPPQTAGGLVTATQADAAGNVSAPATAPAPDFVAPGAPVATVALDGASVVGTGEPGATVIVTAPGTAPGTQVVGTALVGADGSFAATLDVAQRNGESLSVVQRDPAGNVSGAVTAVAPDLTAPPPPANLAVAEGGATLTGTGEAGARVEVRGPAGTLLGGGTVAADGSFAVALAPAVAVGTTLSVTLADAARNVSVETTVTVAIDIDAFDNADSAVIDLVPVATPVNYGTAPYLALVSLGVIDLDAQVLSIPNVGFTVSANHRLDATFTYDAAVDIGAASNYAVAVQRFDGARWVSLDNGAGASLLAVGLLNGNLIATDQLEPGQYRAFLTFDGALGVGVLGSLTVAGVDLDFTAPPAVPEPATGNVITDPGPGGEIDVAGPGTRVTGVGVGAAVTAVAAGGTVVAGAWGTLLINPDGSYTYTPSASAAAVGKTDVFTYTITDPTGGLPESARLSITVGSPDITGAPVAVADQEVASVTFQNVVTTTPIAPAFSFASQPGTGILAPSTGSGASSLTVAPGGVADVTITAVRDPNISASLLPSYTLSITNGAGFSRTETLTAVAGLPIGTGVIFVLDDLPAGSYSYTVTSNALLGSFGTTVSLGTVTTFPNSYEVATRETVTGDLFANDTANALYADLRIGAGIGGVLQVVGTAASITGRYGTLTVDESGHFAYVPSATLAFSAVDLVDSFTYQLVQPNGVVATSTLSVTIDVPGDGTTAASNMLFRIDPVEDDVVPLGRIVSAPPVEATGGAEAGVATYDLFEGRGELEDVLYHYLGSAEGNAIGVPGEVTTSRTPVDMPPAAVADPLGYLVLDPDQHHTGPLSNSVV